VTFTGPYLFDPSKADPNKVGGATGTGVDPTTPGGNMWSNRDAPSTISSNLPVLFVDTTSASHGKNGEDTVYITGIAASGSFIQSLYRYTITDLNDPTKDTWEKVGTVFEGCCGQGAGSIDSDRNLFVRTNSPAGPLFTYWDLRQAGPGNRNVNFTPVDPSGQFGNVRNYGLDFDPVRKHFLLWGGGGDVWAMDYTGDDPSSSNWSLSRLLSASSLVPDPLTTTPGSPGALGGGILGKWKYIAELDAFMGLMDPIEGDVWLYKPIGWVNPLQPGVVDEPGMPVLLIMGCMLLLASHQRRRASSRTAGVC
jgi:hypothetical protein